MKGPTCPYRLYVDVDGKRLWCCHAMQWGEKRLKTLYLSLDWDEDPERSDVTKFTTERQAWWHWFNWLETEGRHHDTTGWQPGVMAVEKKRAAEAVRETPAAQ